MMSSCGEHNTFRFLAVITVCAKMKAKNDVVFNENMLNSCYTNAQKPREMTKISRGNTNFRGKYPVHFLSTYKTPIPFVNLKSYFIVYTVSFTNILGTNLK